MEALLNFSVPTDVNLLDQVVEALYKGGPETKEIQRVLTLYQENPDAWLRVDQILENSQSVNCKFFALQILETCIKTRWKILPVDQRDGIKTYIVGLIMKLAADESAMRQPSNKAYTSKLNLTLVQILKQEWPHNWGNFISEVVELSKTNEMLCENNMKILKLLSEEVFDFSAGQITSQKVAELKTQFNSEFALIYQLCELILDRSTNPPLLTATLQTLRVFLNWIPLGYIFDFKLVETLVEKFFPTGLFRNDALSCLTEVASLTAANYDPAFASLYMRFMAKLVAIVPPDANLDAAYERASESDKEFILQLGLFFCGMFKAHLPLLEQQPHQQALLEGLGYLVRITEVHSEGREIFKICLEYWSVLTKDLYDNECGPRPEQPVLMLTATPNVESPRRLFYAPIFSKLRAVLASNMAKPEEVLVVEDENGEIVRESLKDGDSITLYKGIKETLVYLTNLDVSDTINILQAKLALQVDGTEWSWANLNTLCWAIGSISGAMDEEQEKSFLVYVIKELLGLCENKRGKDNKAVVASNIMYVVGQYPRFLRAHWRFLKTVVNKLFEFMHEPHPGVQDMACDTFLKIAQKCRRKFVTVQHGETVPFVEELLMNLHVTTCDLQPHQVYTFFESVGYLLSSMGPTEAAQRDAFLTALFARSNEKWFEIIQTARQCELAASQPNSLVEFLQTPAVIKAIAYNLTLNVCVAKSLGHPYVFQLTRIFMDTLTIYKMYSQLVSSSVQNQGVIATKTAIVRSMRSVKKETLKLIEAVVEKTEDPSMIATQFVPLLIDPILGDFQRSQPDARDPEVLSLFAQIINKLQSAILPEVPKIFGAVFECTLAMITKNFEDYPEHRINFFKLVRAINNHCFQALFMIHQESFKLMMHSVVWAFKHAERNIAESGLHILLELLQNLQGTPQETYNAFYSEYYLSLLQDLMFVLTDTLHKPGFKLHATILMHLFNIVESGRLQAPLFPGADPSTNPAGLRAHVSQMLTTSFAQLSPSLVHGVVQGLFSLGLAGDLPAFKVHLRDFLIQLKEFAADDNSDLFLEETQAAAAQATQLEQLRLESVPGLLPPNATSEEMRDS